MLADHSRAPFPPAVDQHLAAARETVTRHLDEALDTLPGLGPDITTAATAVALIEQACCAHHLAWIAASAIVRLAVAATDETAVEPILARLHDSLYEGLPPEPREASDAG